MEGAPYGAFPPVGVKALPLVFSTLEGTVACFFNLSPPLLAGEQRVFVTVVNGKWK